MPADHASMALTAESPGLCDACDFVHRVKGRRGQTYLLCRNERIAAKYPPQPVFHCPGYVRRPAVSAAGGSGETGGP